MNFLVFFDHNICSAKYMPVLSYLSILKHQPKMKKVFFIVVCSVLCLPGCNLTRTVTTKSEYMQRGDTSVVIQTKTVETYDATKK